MGSFIAQQPNGLYCRFSTIVGTVTHYNMTKDDYIEVCKDRLGKKRGEEEANDILKNYLHPFNDVLERFIPNNRYFGSPTYRGNIHEYIRDGEQDSQYPHPDLLESLMNFPIGWTERSV